MLSNVRPVPLLIGSVAVCAALTGLIWVLGGRLDGVALLPDQGASWYYWKLPEPTVLSRATAWGGYVAHQLAFWLLIFYAQTRVRRYSAGLHPVNLVALATNLGFVGLHLVQTHLFYDGLAQDVSIFSSQGSVVLLLVVVLLMENRRRGLFFGRKVPFRAAVIDFVRRYHGYLFSWAAVYTFWYHPAVSTSGHLIGFGYLFLLLVQGSLFLTRAHTNRVWTLTLEIMVAVHGTLVAVMNSGPDGIWPMFLFGFLGVFVITQLHGLGLSRMIKTLVIIGYGLAAILVYLARGRPADLHEIIRIPLIEYALVFVVAGLVWLALWVRDRRRPRPAEPAVSPAVRTPRSAGPARPGTRPDR
ncbi:hypothetical protein [Microlunatus sp. GCM10028923]|uniref:hypothetical protein n=1 Tax=Microlunatus sp. GCM10028923 TaxID=3273400 RepID=UPI00361279FF